MADEINADPYAEIRAYVQKRNAVLLRMDETELLELYNENTDDKKIDTSSITFWAGVHYARLAIIDFPEDAKEESRKWLNNNGFPIK